jgi:pimeloyl-ACP methyl ester carboxylesterase
VLPISRLAVYEPPVAIATLLPLGWVPAFRAALDADRPARAMAILGRGMEMLPSMLPVRVLAPMFWLMMRGSAGREMATLLRTFPSDLALGLSAGTDVSRYREVKCPTLLLGGARSPHYLHRALELVHEVLPDVRRVELASVGHNAPDGQAPDLVAAELVRFFTASDAAAPGSEQAATR